MKNPKSKREQNRAQNYRELIDATLEVFATIGYENATVRDIVSASQLSRGTFYNYFGDKDKALAAVAEHLIQHIGVRVQAARAAATDSESLIADAFAAMIAAIAEEPRFVPFISRNGDALRAVVGELEPTAAIEADLRRDLDHAVAAGLLPPHRTDWLAAAMVGGAIEVVTRINDGDDPVEAGRFLTRLYLQGVNGLS